MPAHYYGEVLSTTDLSTGLRVYQKRTPDTNVILRALRAGFVFYGDPTFTNLYWEIYSYNGTAPYKLLATSTTVRTKTQIITDEGLEDYSKRQTWWEFNYFPMKEGEVYYFVPRATGYTYADASHIALVKDWPFPAYAEGLGYGVKDAHRAKYEVLFWTGDYIP